MQVLVKYVYLMFLVNSVILNIELHTPDWFNGANQNIQNRIFYSFQDIKTLFIS